MARERRPAVGRTPHLPFPLPRAPAAAGPSPRPGVSRGGRTRRSPPGAPAARATSDSALPAPYRGRVGDAARPRRRRAWPHPRAAASANLRCVRGAPRGPRRARVLGFRTGGLLGDLVPRRRRATARVDRPERMSGAEVAERTDPVAVGRGAARGARRRSGCARRGGSAGGSAEPWRRSCVNAALSRAWGEDGAPRSSA